MGWLLARPLEAEAREDPLPRLATGAFVGALSLVALSWPLVHPSPAKAAERHFRRELHLFANDEQQILADQAALDQLERTKKITHREWGRRLANNILPKWEAAEGRISASELPRESKLIPLRAALIEGLDKKRFALDLLSDAARYNDADKLEWGNSMLEGSKVKEMEVRSLIRELY